MSRPPTRQNSWESLYEEDNVSSEIRKIRYDFDNVKVNVDRDFTTPIFRECHNARSSSRSLRKGVLELSKAFPALLLERNRGWDDPNGPYETAKGQINELLHLRRNGLEDDNVFRLIDDSCILLDCKPYIKLATLAKMLEYWSDAYEAEMSVRKIYLEDEKMIYGRKKDIDVHIEEFQRAIGNQDINRARQALAKMKGAYARIIEFLKQSRGKYSSREIRRIVERANAVIRRSMENMNRLRRKVEAEAGRKGRANARRSRRGDINYNREPRRIWPKRFGLGSGNKRSTPLPDSRREYPALRRGTLRPTNY
ncbi:hypothetical protein A7U60_g4045 [Sanghuangporus baumii]|uniref:Uncharacterized protein n=1 Tax=Sanghuangporus baumii TaxID=108892 RepID=A0A9Q5N9F8_SANBA|nr:hypothetical protein A7U60_g4045 [Sanghuangporus baumii]